MGDKEKEKEKEAKLGYPKNYALHDGEIWLVELTNAKTGERIILPLLWALDNIHAKSTPIPEKE